jgi:hypothetical protein
MPRSVDSLSPAERRAVEASPFLSPESWGVEVAAETLGTSPITFVRSKVGSGTGYGYVAVYAFAPNHAGPVWSALTAQWLAPSEYLPPGVESYKVLGCVYAAKPDLLGYAVVLDPPNPTAREAISGDTLVRPTGWYRWRSGTPIHAERVPAEVLKTECRARLHADTPEEGP